MAIEQIEKTPSIPKAKKVPHEIVTHGDKRMDNYFWLRDMDRQNPEVIAHLELENAYTEAVMSSTEELQTELFEELKGRVKQNDVSVPYLYDDYYYYTRYEEGKEYPIYCRKPNNETSAEEIMLDVNALAIDYSYYHVSNTSVSTNNDLLAFSEDTLSRRVYAIRIKSLRTGQFLEDRIEETDGSCVWANDNKSLFYTRKDKQTLRSFKVFRHVLGTDPANDEEVFHEKDGAFHVGIGKSKSKKWLFIQSSATVSDEYRILDANTPQGHWKVFQPRQRHLEYDLFHYNGYFYVLTNFQARNFRLMKTSETSTEVANWTEVVPHRDDVLLEDVDVFSDYLVLTEKYQATNRIRIINWKSDNEYFIPFNEEAYHVKTGTNPDFNTHKLRYLYQSMCTPITVVEYDMETHERTLLKEQEVLGGFDKNDYESKRLWFTARDGTQVPLSMVYRKGLKIDQNTPLLLYGYGSYGINMDPYFSPSRISLLDRGFIHVIAHIRGSQILGRLWYENGKMLNKKNTFCDFIDCAEFLIKEGYTSPKHLYAMGGSAGGLLMGAVMNMRPDLWNGVIAVVPFVDVLSTMLDETIPLTTGEYDEWGNPNHEEYYYYIKSYSPYDNIEAKRYPHILVTTGLHDSQVQYWEPAKWVSKLRELKTDNNLLLLKTNMEFGHSGASGRFQVYHEIALEYAFLIHLEQNHGNPVS